MVHRRHEVHDYESSVHGGKKDVTMLVGGITRVVLAFVGRRIYEKFLRRLIAVLLN